MTFPTSSPAVEFVFATRDIDADDWPAIMEEWIRDGRLDRDFAGRVAGWVWQKSANPEQALGTTRWVELFRWAGFQVDDDEITPPTGPLTVYRGATEKHKRGMAWTTDPATAVEFVARFGAEPVDAYVYTATIPPEGVLAMFGHEEVEGIQAEFEVVVDPALLADIERTDLFSGEADR